MDGYRLSSNRSRARSSPGRFLSALVLVVCSLVIVHTFFLEPYQVPTGSMAPALLGNHRTCVCPRCSFAVDVGCAQEERDYAHAFCPNCGCQDLRLSSVPQSQGDQVLVNKAIYALRAPRRWEVIVFRLFGKTFIKRLIGLGGEEIEIVDGDVYIDGELARKNFDELLAMRVPVFDSAFVPDPGGWRDRWEFQPERSLAQSSNDRLVLDGREMPQKLTYRHFSLEKLKSTPLTDEYAYNAGFPRSAEAVHDFMVDADVQIMAGHGTFAIGLNDGELTAEVELGVGPRHEVVIYIADPAQAVGLVRRCVPTKVQLLQGKCYHFEMALVDRRLAMRIDGVEAFAPMDLCMPRHREAVVTPVTFAADRLAVSLNRVRLYRDVHYSQAGANAVHGQGVRLGINQLFVLGDNSGNSEDSRYWPNQGIVPAENVVGRAFFVHLPSQAVSLEAMGRQWRLQFPNWEHIRWLK
jgi:signal peptidase I